MVRLFHIKYTSINQLTGRIDPATLCRPRAPHGGPERGGPRGRGAGRGLLSTGSAAERLSAESESWDMSIAPLTSIRQRHRSVGSRKTRSCSLHVQVESYGMGGSSGSRNERYDVWPVEPRRRAPAISTSPSL